MLFTCLQSIHRKSFKASRRLTGSNHVGHSKRITARRSLAPLGCVAHTKCEIRGWAAAVEEEAWEYVRRIDGMGGSVRAIEERFMQREIEESAFRYQREVERGERIIVGVTRYASGAEDDPDMELHNVDESIRERQSERLIALRESRDNAAVERALADLRDAAVDSDNLLYPAREALANLATVGEVSDVLRETFGEYRPS